MSIYDIKVLGHDPLSNENSKWIKLEMVKYLNPQGQVCYYERVKRSNRPGKVEGSVDATSIIAILVKRKKQKQKRGGVKVKDDSRKAARQSGPDEAVKDGENDNEDDNKEENEEEDDDDDDDGLTYPRVVVEKQFRPPVGKVSIEFPAGLVDPNETLEACALRELKEETGYVGTICDGWNIPIGCTDAGVGGTILKTVVVEIDMHRPENKNPVANLEPAEYMEVTSLSLDNLKQEVDELGADERCILDTRISMFAEGLEMAKRMSRFT